MTTVYETIRVKDGTVPLLARHLQRLKANSSALDLQFPMQAEAVITGAVTKEDCQLRVTWDGATLDIERRPVPSLAPFDVRTVSVRHEGYRVKTTERLVFEQARAEARALGADEGLLLTREGYVAEGTLFAVAWIDDDTLRLPTLELGILPSVGRARVLDVAHASGMPVEEGWYRRNDLDGRAVFATTATRGVVEIAHLDGVSVPRDARVERLARRFWPEPDSDDS